MDVERADRDRRVEDASAEALLLLADRAEIEHQRDQTNHAIADVLRRLVAKGIGAEAVARFVQLEVPTLMAVTAVKAAGPTDLNLACSSRRGARLERKTAGSVGAGI